MEVVCRPCHVKVYGRPRPIPNIEAGTKVKPEKKPKPPTTPKRKKN